MHVLMYVYLPYTLSETRYFVRGSIFRESEKQTHFRESDVNHVMKTYFHECSTHRHENQLFS